MTIRQLIVEAMVVGLEPLKLSQGVERVERRRSVASEQKRSCAIDVVIGDDEVVARENLGYVLEFPVNLKITKKVPGADVFAGLEEIKGAVQDVMEADDQLGGLAISVTYAGEVEVGTEDGVPTVILVYVVRYRRRQGRTGERY